MLFCVIIKYKLSKFKFSDELILIVFFKRMNRKVCRNE